MERNLVFGLLMMAATAFVGSAALAAEPSLHQVYQAAEAGKLSEAQTMMREVLQAHPNSGKAHFVQAELLARQGRLVQAEVELANAERLAPGLPFAKPEAVQNLKTLLSRPARSAPAAPQVAQFAAAPAAPAASFPWGMLLLGAAVLGFIALAARWLSQRNATAAAGQGIPAGAAFPGGTYGGGGGGYGGAYGSSNVPQPYGPTLQGGPAAAAGSGLGSRILGGLATGAAVGAGVVAGEALLNRFIGGKDETADSATPLPPIESVSLLEPSANDMGGSDFGISDSSSWDDSSSDDSDWN